MSRKLVPKLIVTLIGTEERPFKAYIHMNDMVRYLTLSKNYFRLSRNTSLPYC